MDTPADFVSKFHHLEGIHYTERKKNFQKLLHLTDRQTVAQALNNSVIPIKGYLEEIFYVDMLIYAKQIDKLIEILKEGNSILISRILKQKWFFEEAFQTMNQTELVNEFLPSLSYSIRMKVLKKLALTLSESRMDLIFDLLFERYGLFIAQQFLFSCSSAKIATVLQNNVIHLSVEQLKRLLQKNSHLVKVYFEEYKNNFGKDYSDQYFFRYLIWKYPNLYFEFLPHLEGMEKVGRQTTKTILKINKEEVLSNLNHITSRLHVGSVVRKVQTFDDEHLYKLFPTEINDLISKYTSWSQLRFYLQKYPQKRRWEVFSEGFKKAYKDDIANHLKTLFDSIEAIIPLELKRECALMKYKDTQDSSYIKYMELPTAFAITKEIINVTSEPEVRRHLLVQLIELCHANKDYKSYEELLKYIYDRHRNENASIFDRLLSAINSKLDHTLATEGLWEQINNLIAYAKIKSESVRCFDLVSKYLVFLFDRKSPFDDAIELYVTDHKQADNSSGTILGCLNNKPEVKRELIVHLTKHLHKFEENNKEEGITLLFENLVDFSLKNKEYWIDLEEYPVFLEAIRETVEKKKRFSTYDMIRIKNFILYNYTRSSQKRLKLFDADVLLDTIKSMCLQHRGRDSLRLYTCLLEAIKKPRTTDFQEKLLPELISFYIPNFQLNEDLAWFNFEGRIANYLIEEEPELFAKYVDNFLTFDEQRVSIKYANLKFYTHLGLDEAFENRTRPLVLPESNNKSKKQLIAALSSTMNTERFVSLIEGYLPKEPKVDLNDEKQTKLFETQSSIAKNLKKLSEPYKLIPVLPFFCSGDYLQTSLPLLYHTLYCVEERQALKFLESLADKAVSARKHSVFLALELQPQTEALALFQVLVNKAGDVSSKKYLFRAVLKYFLRNPSEHLLHLALTNITFVDKNDKQLLEDLVVSIGKVPNKFKPTFVEHFWRSIDALEEQDFKGDSIRVKVLKEIGHYDNAFFLQLTDKFCQDVIKRYFFSENYVLLRSGKMYHFVINYLISRNDDESFSFVFGFINSFKTSHWEANQKEMLNLLFYFFDSVYSAALHRDVTFLKRFKENWEKIFSLTESFLEYVELQLMLFYKENTNVADFCKLVNKNFKDVVGAYGPDISHFLFKGLNNFSSAFTPDEKVYNPYRVAWNLLKAETNGLNCLIAYNMVVNNDGRIDKEALDGLLELIHSMDGLMAKVYWNGLVKREFV